MTIFWIIWSFNALACLVPIYFFFYGLVDGTVSESNSMLWFGILAVIGGVMFGSYVAYSHLHIKLAIAICQVITIPAVFALLYFLIILISKPRWN
jgi:hypothetical protein